MCKAFRMVGVAITRLRGEGAQQRKAGRRPKELRKENPYAKT